MLFIRGIAIVPILYLYTVLESLLPFIPISTLPIFTADSLPLNDKGSNLQLNMFSIGELFSNKILLKKSSLHNLMAILLSVISNLCK